MAQDVLFEWFWLPALQAVPGNLSPIAVSYDDASLGFSIERSFLLQTSTAAPISASNMDYLVSYEVLGGNWLSVEMITVGDEVNVRLIFDSQRIATLANGTHKAVVYFIDRFGEYKKFSLVVRLTVSLTGVS